jgi:hypothetical protein
MQKIETSRMMTLYFMSKALFSAKVRKNSPPTKYRGKKVINIATHHAKYEL